MAWVFIIIAFGAAAFLVLIVLDYLKVSGGLKPMANQARAEIRECESKIEAEQGATTDAKEQVTALQKEIEGLEKELAEISKKVEDYREREKRRKPTKFKLGDA